jgi:hypothetical protein
VLELKRLVDFHSFVGGSAGCFGLILIKEKGGCNGKPYQKIALEVFPTISGAPPV